MEEIRQAPTEFDHKLIRVISRAIRHGLLLPEITWLAERRVVILFRDSENQIVETLELIGELHWRHRQLMYEGDVPEQAIKILANSVRDQERLNGRKTA